MPPSSLQQTRKNLQSAVHQNEAASRAGFLERLFTFAFKGLVYPQIWEDPKVDLEALALTPDSRMLAIASGGCNVLSYLTANPKEIIAVDLNRAHLALTRLKLAAAQGMPTYEAFYRFFGEADTKANVNAYKRFVQERLDKESRKYWEGRDWMMQRRISLFSRDLYHHGLLGYFIGVAHWMARLHGTDPRHIVWARTIDEQRTFFDTALAPLFDRRMVRWVTSKKMSLYGLGIPPAQYEALAADGNGDMAAVLKARLEKLACGFEMKDNYFAWQAFGRGYASGPSGPLPPYLQADHYTDVRDRAHRVKVFHRSFTEQLNREQDATLDAYVLLDAQDWMTDAQLNELWAEITRTAQPGARVVFRTAGAPTILPGRVGDAIMERWDYRAEESLDCSKRDRSAIYGGMHLYVFKG
ncbi:BtaA family protein [Pyruvatibacter sp.]